MRRTIEVAPNYQPIAGKQAQFHADRGEFWVRLISAGTGAGKTYAGLYEAWAWTCGYPGSVGLILEPTYGMIDRILLPTIEEFFGTTLANCKAVLKYSRFNNRVDWINGSTWWLLSLDDPEKCEGQNVDWAWIDEFRLIGGSGAAAKKKQELSWNVIIRRLRGSVPKKFDRISKKTGKLIKFNPGLWITTTPDQPGSLLFNRFEHPRDKLPKSKVYRWSIDENPLLPEQYKREVKRAHVMGTGLYKRFVLGMFAAVATGTFMFDSTIHVLTKLPDKEKFHQMVYGVDWGWSNPACIIAVGLDGDGRAYIVDEFYQSRCKIETLIQSAKEMQDRWGEGTFFCDRSEPASIDAFIDAELDAVADGTKREDGLRKFGGRFPLEDDGKPRIFVYEGCVNWIAEIQSYDEKVKELDHAMDATRYAIANASDLSGEIQIEFGKRP